MSDDAWLSCPSCGLKHRARPEGTCPRCGAPVHGTIVGTPDLPPPESLNAPSAPNATGRPSNYADFQKGTIASDREGVGFAILTGLIGAAVGGGIWAAVVLLTGYEVGWVAWGVGAVAGIGVRFGLGDADNGMLIGGGCAVFGFLLGKILIATLFTAGDVSELVQDEEYVTIAMMARMVDEGEIPADVGRFIRIDNEEEPSPEATVALEEYFQAAQVKSYELSTDERYELVKWYSGKMLGDLSLGTRLMLLFSFWDLLWFFLAVSTGAKVAVGGDED